MTESNESANLKALRDALLEIEETSGRPTDGKWLEELTAACAPLIAEWDVREAWIWDDWPEKNHPDSGIDVVAERADGELIAIQCKSRELDEQGSGAPVNKGEINSFIAESSSTGHSFAERWLVVNGAVNVNANALRVMEGNKVAHINLYADIKKHLDGAGGTPLEDPALTAKQDTGAMQTRDSMQQEAVESSVAALKGLAQSGTGAARGRIILPCGTGKSRIALRLIEALTEPGQVSAILCPSIALVSQLRREFLINGSRPLAALAVCSDQTAAHGSDLSKDQTADLSRASARDVKGRVTTDASEIAEWMGALPEGHIGVIFGTYQSSHKIAEALTSSGTTLAVMVADEAHRTAGIRRVKAQEERLRDFTVCHQEQAFPATYRIYQTATPKIYKTQRERNAEKRMQSRDWIVRSMDDENVFGPELYRKSYRDAVESGWLSDYRIIALGVNDTEAYQTANRLAGQKDSNLSTVQFLRGLALALVMGGATRKDGHVIRSSINFLNTIKKSKGMTEALASKTVRGWVGNRLAADGVREERAQYRLQHLDADSNVAQREQAKAQLAAATDETPHGILNVGIFGEGTDAPSLSAVGFIEPRKSPVDVIQAVGRVMRRSEGKKMGYIVCPIVIPPNVDAERWLANSNSPDDGWQALGQILMALRAHDDRIEERLEDLMSVYLPPAPPEEEEVSTVVAVGSDTGRAAYFLHEGKQGQAERATENVVKGTARSADVFRPLNEAMPEAGGGAAEADATKTPPRNEPHRIVTGKLNWDNSFEMREHSVERDKPRPDGTPGPINLKKTKAAARKMLNGEQGRKITRPRKRKTQEELADLKEQQTLKLLSGSKADDMGIFVNLLEKSGLCRNKAQRSVNTLEEAIAEAKLRLEEDELAATLNAHFGLDRQSGTAGKDYADGCTIASLLLMNAAMLHQRIAAGAWLPGVNGLDGIKAAPNAAQLALRQWNTITRHDFRPVLEPAIEVIWKVQDTGRESGLNKAMRHIAAEAERLAEDYADLGADYAGELFNKVMGNQASDGAYFTRPAAASLLARLALDAAAPDGDWSGPDAWESNRVVDLACGSGTLLAASLTEVKRRARERGASERQLAELQKLAVEKTIVGLDFNPVSLQLAAAQLTSGNADITYRNMGLHKMPYGPTSDHEGEVRAGSLEMLGQRRVIGMGDGLDLGEQSIGSERLQLAQDDPMLEDAVDAVLGARVVIMNPPFTSREKMGEKFSEGTKKRLREKVDALERGLVQNDPELDDVVSTRSIGPLFEALAEKCVDAVDGVVAMVWPTVVFTGPDALSLRRIFASRFHIHTLITCHQPGNINLSQNTSINESLIIARRHESRKGAKPPTRIISLDKMPIDEEAVAELHDCLVGCETGLLTDGWGEVSNWPAERIEAGDWTAGVFRAPELANGAFNVSTDESLLRMEDQNMVPSAVLSGGAQLREFGSADVSVPGGFPVLYSKAAAAQRTIRGVPDQHWAPKRPVPRREWIETPGTDEPQHPDTARRIVNHSAHLLVTAGQDTGTGRLTAVAQEELCVGVGWLPVPGVTLEKAKAAAVFLNSTAGRLQLLRNPGRKLAFPQYRPAGLKTIRLPDLSDSDLVDALAGCWEATAETEVPQYRNGECEVRRIWDDAVADAIGWDKKWLSELRHLLHQEPHVRGLGLNQFG